MLLALLKQVIRSSGDITKEFDLDYQYSRSSPRIRPHQSKLLDYLRVQLSARRRHARIRNNDPGSPCGYRGCHTHHASRPRASTTGGRDEIRRSVRGMSISNERLCWLLMKSSARDCRETFHSFAGAGGATATILRKYLFETVFDLPTTF